MELNILIKNAAIKVLARKLGPKYFIDVIDHERVICRDFHNGYSVEVSNAHTSKGGNVTIYLWRKCDGQCDMVAKTVPGVKRSDIEDVVFNLYAYSDSNLVKEMEDNKSSDAHAAHIISDSWEEIVAAGNDGTYADKYHIGDTKKLNLGEEGIITMELVAFDADELADGSGKAHMTWIAKDFLKTRHPMNEIIISIGGWPASDIRKWFHDSILPLIPNTVRSNIKKVKKYSYSHYPKGTVFSSDKIWIPSCREVFGSYNSFEDTGPEYLMAFPDTASRIKRWNGTPFWWWLRSASSGGDDSFCSVDYDGSDWGNDLAGYEFGVAVGFCL